MLPRRRMTACLGLLLGFAFDWPLGWGDGVLGTPDAARPYEAPFSPLLLASRPEQGLRLARDADNLIENDSQGWFPRRRRRPGRRTHNCRHCSTRVSLSTPGGTRTPNLLIRSQTLYPFELRARDLPIIAGTSGEDQPVQDHFRRYQRLNPDWLPDQANSPTSTFNATAWWIISPLQQPVREISRRDRWGRA